MNKADKVKSYIFIAFLLIIIIGGFILTRQSFSINLNKKDNDVKEEKKDIRIDKTKDYIYFTNNNRVVDELDIEFQDIVINFNDPNNIASTLNNENKELSKSLVYDDTLEDTSYNKLSTAKYTKYELYTFDNYISLVIHYYSFDRENLVSFQKTKTYNFAKDTGLLINENDLLKEYDLDKEKVNNIIKEHLEGEDLVKEDEVLDITSTLENINEYPLYVDKIGRLTISILVKSDQKDYNETIILN